jgi:hypothetical protein
VYQITVSRENTDKPEISMITEGLATIKVRISIICPRCGYERVFGNELTIDKMELILVTIKIIEWLTCEICDTLFDNTIEFTI